MKALRSFTVRHTLPSELAALETLAMNLRWAWDAQTRDLFRWVDPEQWDVSIHDPVRLLGLVPRSRLDALAQDPGFLRFLDEVHTELQNYLTKPRWFQVREHSAEPNHPGRPASGAPGPGNPLRLVAYFSPEFGIAEALPQYSGGLGVLAGDHLKAASDLGLPLVGVGLMYRHGYFRQGLTADGWQEERYPNLDPYAMALTREEGARVEVDLAGTPCVAQVWRAEVGRIPLFLLDSDVDENPPEIRGITDRLYGGDTEHRLRQEILLGVGGVRALDAVGVGAQVFHTNEGHAGFLGLERIRQLVTREHLTYPEAIEAVRGANIFTTHTPVPAGIDRFPRELIEKYFSGWAAEVGVTIEDLMALGHHIDEPPDEPFNMAVMGLRLAGHSNAVSKLHRRVSQEMFGDLWPDVPTDEDPVFAVTNGVHAATWVSPEMNDLMAQYVLPEWSEAGPDRWEHVADARDDEIWRAREQGRQRLVAFARRRLKEMGVRRGLSASDVSWTEEALDPSILTIGFARRFATYKRATLLLSQPDRLRAMLSTPNRAVQFLFAGKAHPADEKGKDMIRQIVAFAADVDVRHRFVFLEDYDIAGARALYQGADVWLNTPRRPREACGTSGMKAALSGALNCSILDGWWDEMFDGENGWAISSAEHVEDPEHRDQLEANSLFDLLERQIVPLFYDRYEGPVPRRWVRKVKRSLCSLGPQVTAARMVRDYLEQHYEPTAERGDRLAADGYARAKQLAAWKARVQQAWEAVTVEAIDTASSVTSLGETRTIEAVAALGELTADDVEVQLVHGPVGLSDEIEEPEVETMEPVGEPEGDGRVRYRGAFECDRAGRYGFTVRVVPCHPDLATPLELGRIAWA
ncbi:MAG: alpha-glucan family phosphorylase [Acidimicrobiales bacterium]